MPVRIAGLHTVGMPIRRRFGIVGLGFYVLVFDNRAALRLAILWRLRGSSSMFGSGTHDGSFAMTQMSSAMSVPMWFELNPLSCPNAKSLKPL
jgi:hypothetical protein